MPVERLTGHHPNFPNTGTVPLPLLLAVKWQVSTFYPIILSSDEDSHGLIKLAGIM